MTHKLGKLVNSDGLFGSEDLLDALHLDAQPLARKEHAGGQNTPRAHSA
jgi:hypothetical protein